MKCVAAVALIASAQAFMPAAPLAGVKSGATMTMSGADTRRAFVEQGFAAAAAVAALAVPQIALADGAVSEATVQRAKGIYGGRLVALAGAVKSGDFAAVAAEKNAVKLLASGGFAMSSKEDRKEAQRLASAIYAAINSKDASALQTNYTALIKLANIPPPDSKGDNQGYSSDFDWKIRTPKGTIYQR